MLNDLIEITIKRQWFKLTAYNTMLCTNLLLFDDKGNHIRHNQVESKNNNKAKNEENWKR